jgi:hypothetical protein
MFLKYAKPTDAVKTNSDGTVASQAISEHDSIRLPNNVEPRRMSEHMRMDLERQLGLDASSLDQLSQASNRERRTTLPDLTASSPGFFTKRKQI